MLSLIFPKRCVLCRAHLPLVGQAMLCASCQTAVRRSYRHVGCVRVCGADDAAAALYYTDAVRRALVRYKFQHQKGYARWFAAQTAPVLAARLDQWRPDALTYVPTGWLSRRTRGYDQSAYIARLLGAQLGIPVEPLLRKRIWARKQSRLRGEDRARNAARAYLLRPHACAQGKRLVLVDDVLTSGATMAVCAQLLRDAGAVTVFALAVTKTPD